MNDRGDIEIAYPICAIDEVRGVTVSVRVIRDEKSNMKNLWEGEGAVSDEVKRGVFVVGVPDSFRHEGKPLAGELPKGFFVLVEERRRDGTVDDGRGGWVDLSIRPPRLLKPGEYQTSDGKIVSRQWVNNQLGCNARA
ncbi:hypothetical protein AB0467_22980 [Streptomyces sp. NPDC052095]|uniref:hypothetical protein n=1 Tax=unclassified Streptomyces TaxID=2593676 RepID=UPI00344C6CFA